MPLPTSITTRLEYQHKTLIELIEGLSDEQVRRQVMTGKWSIFENLVHLGTYQHTFSRRIDKILNEKDPQFERYSAESDPLFLDNCSKSTREAMQDLIASRREMISKTFSLNDEQLLHKGVHPVFGAMTLKQWVNFFLLHEAHNLFTIFKLAAEFRKGN